MTNENDYISQSCLLDRNENPFLANDFSLVPNETVKGEWCSRIWRVIWNEFVLNKHIKSDLI